MKLRATLSLLAIFLVGLSGTALAQQNKCKFNIVGTWKAQISTTESRLYTFDDKGVVKVLAVSGATAPREISTAKYEFLDDPNAPERISLRATGKNRIFGRLRTAMKVVSYDDSSITCQIPGVGTTRWTRVDTDRYFIVFVARKGEFYDSSGSAFPVVIKLAEGVSKIDAAGIYSDKGTAAFGTVPANTFKEYLRDARGDSEVILRLEINSQQYERTLKIVQEWQRRAREDALLYTTDTALFTPPLPLNNILLVKAVAETLNLCQSDFDLYKLDYVHPGDWITNDYSPEFVPFFFFKELRRRNEARHIEYKKFQELVPMANVAIR
jgi:hypothetical protein